MNFQIFSACVFMQLLLCISKEHPSVCNRIHFKKLSSALRISSPWIGVRILEKGVENIRPLQIEQFCYKRRGEGAKSYVTFESADDLLFIFPASDFQQRDDFLQTILYRGAKGLNIIKISKQ